jgi:hypothetical protein
VDDDAALFAWIRHYAAMLLLFVALGGAVGFLYTHVVPRRVQAWTLVVETGARIGPRQLGPVAQALFHSSDVYRPAMRQLGITESPIRFFDRDVSVQPVPTTNTLIVVGTAGSLTRAERISSVMASSFVQALRSRGFIDFHIFGSTQPAPVRVGVSTKVAFVVGAVAALWLGLALGIVHYRLRRPVLSASVAASLSGADAVVELEGSRPSWLGVLRGHPRWRANRRNRAVLEGFVAATGRAVFMAPQLDPARRERVAQQLGYAAADGDGTRGGTVTVAEDWDEARRVASEPTVLLCDPATRQGDLAMVGSLRHEAGSPAPRLELLWIR